MWYPHTVTVAAASEPVTLAEAKAQCRIDSSDFDTELNGYIAAARDHVEGYCGTPIVSRTIAVKCDSFDDFAAFPIVPLSAVSAVSYVDTDGQTQTLSTDVYEVRTDGLTAAIVLKYGQAWPSIRSGSRITVTATAGYSAVPGAVKQAMLLLIGHWNRTHEAVSTHTMNDVPHAVDALLANKRVFL